MSENREGKRYKVIQPCWAGSVGSVFELTIDDGTEFPFFKFISGELSEIAIAYQDSGIAIATSKLEELPNE